MKSKNSIVFLTSMKNLSKRLEFYGDAKIENISLLKLIYKYACYSTTYNQLVQLDKMVSKLQIEDPLICLEKHSLVNDYGSTVMGNVEIDQGSNQAPNLDNSTVVITGEEEEHFFTYEELFSGYSDDSNEDLSSFVINSLPDSGILLYNGMLVELNTPLEDVSKLSYSRASDTAYSETMTISAYDSGQVSLVSNIATITLDVQEVVVENLPPTIGDTNIYSDNRTTTIFSSADFTINADPSYNDPEGDPLDAIRILEISSINKGKYFYLGSEVSVGQVITKSELNSGAFYHVAADVNAISTDIISVAVRDTGSMQWVE